jgi:fido (protein-threonine AMPylation protein)
VRFHHRLVSIHPFANGNGRHARLMTDLLLESMGAKPLSWGRAKLTTRGQARARYIAALQSADRGDLKPLRDFAQS